MGCFLPSPTFASLETLGSCRHGPRVPLTTLIYFSPSQSFLISSVQGSCTAFQSLDSCFISMTLFFLTFVDSSGLWHALCLVAPFIYNICSSAWLRLIDLWCGHTCVALSSIKSFVASPFSSMTFTWLLEFSFCFHSFLITDWKYLHDTSAEQLYWVRETSVNQTLCVQALYDFIEHLHTHSIFCDPHNSPVR